MDYDLLRRLSGLTLDDERFQELIERYRPILSEIEKLRALELKDTHPAVVFDPVQLQKLQ
ncbi:hypothetical protein [Pikeienuella sp. HZG-20]|uniref:hypothetical protein n=1 Tax=Paludibacillus litoralis TaxID=3133267 RepID=UPI0030ECD0AE